MNDKTLKSSRRPPIDLLALTSELAQSMPEAVQRTAPQPVVQVHQTPAEPVAVAAKPAPVAKKGKGAVKSQPYPSDNFESLAFKVPAEFRIRFRTRAGEADLKLNELLFEALDAWEQKRGIKK
jgi:hypothetical protein